MKKYTFWLKAGIIFQILTAIVHSLSLITKQQGSNDTEKQMLDLMNNYKVDLGGGFMRSMSDIMTSFSISFTLFLFFGGFMSLFLLRKKLGADLMKGVIGINLVFYGLCFLQVILLTFWPPIICLGLIFISYLLAYLTVPRTQNPL